MDRFVLMTMQLQGLEAPPLPALPGTHYRPLDRAQAEDVGQDHPDPDRGSEVDFSRPRGNP
jgi:hypothetical protein